MPAVPEEDDSLCADVNEDGLVNVLDIIFMVNYILGGNPNPFNVDAADVKADGAINVLDIIALVNIILQVPGIPCPCTPAVTFGEKNYFHVQIGDQCWFKENLDAGTMITSNAGGQLQTNNGVIEKYCFNNLAANCTTYGGLYEWNEAMQYVTAEGAQGICPAGWHIPSDSEFTILTNYLGGEDVAGGKMKEAGLTHWAEPNAGATNESGFTCLPGGYRDNGNGNFIDLTNYGNLWTSSQNTVFMAWYRNLYFNGANI